MYPLTLWPLTVVNTVYTKDFRKYTFFFCSIKLLLLLVNLLLHSHHLFSSFK